ncbi:MAG: pilus assembly protein [Acidobacteria bacterium]|nr:pilus assembly protein [Acidobacteriota bacterium]
MKPTGHSGAGIAAPKRRRRGSETIEFALSLIPYLAVITVLCDASWSIFVKATLQSAVRNGVRTGITITGTQATAASETLTQMVKDVVQNTALGLLSGTSGRAYIQVHYLAQDSSSPSGVTDVSTQANGNAPGNLMQVSVSAYPVGALMPRIYGLFIPVDNNPALITVVSADRIEPSGDVPPIGTAP